MGRSQHARQTVQSWGKVVTGGRFSSPCVKPHPHSQRSDLLRPRFGENGPLALDRRGEGSGRDGKGCLHGIANRLEVDATVGGDRLTQEGKVAIDRRAHLLPVSLPQPR